MKHHKLITALSICFSTFFHCAAQQESHQDELIESVNVVITDDAYLAPDSVRSGFVSLHLDNRSSEMHSAHLIKLENGYSTQELISAYTDSLRNSGGRPDWMIHRGGVISEPGTSSIIMYLEPGQYTWVCVMGSDTNPHFAGHEHKSLTVHGEPKSGANLPKADLTITMTDDGFDMSESIVQGDQSIDILNSGSKYHLVAISKLNTNSTAQDLINWFSTYQGPPPAQGVIATSAIGPELNARINISFEPGEYILYCMANADGQFHLLDGEYLSSSVN